MWRQYAVDCAKDRRTTPTVADAMFARVDNSSASSALCAICYYRSTVAPRGRTSWVTSRSPTKKMLHFLETRSRSGVSPERTVSIKVSTLTSLITGTDKALRRGADTGERRATRPRTYIEIARDPPIGRRIDGSWPRTLVAAMTS